MKVTSASMVSAHLRDPLSCVPGVLEISSQESRKVIHPTCQMLLANGRDLVPNLLRLLCVVHKALCTWFKAFRGPQGQHGLAHILRLWHSHVFLHQVGLANVQIREQLVILCKNKGSQWISPSSNALQTFQKYAN
jgi:hypothetical protein